VNERLLTVEEAAARLRIRPTTLYDWLGRSDRGLLVLRGRSAAIRYFQSGAQGQGRILIPEEELDALLQAMTSPRTASPLPKARSAATYPGIVVPLGKPRHGPRA
jgi:hypothetical protein